MTVYFDSSVITKWYLPEEDSTAALELRDKYRPPAVFTPLHRIELVTAWSAKAFRGEISERVLTQALADLEADVALGLWATVGHDLSDIFREATGLSRRYTPLIGARTLDILHVASALTLRVNAFVTNDERQGQFAKEVGLNSVPLHAKRPRSVKRRPA